MVIIRTNAVDVSIQAVSPELILSVPISCGSVGAAGAAAASADAGAAAESGAGALAADAASAGGVSAIAVEADTARNARKTNLENLFISVNPLLLIMRLHRAHRCEFAPLAQGRKQIFFRRPPFPFARLW